MSPSKHITFTIVARNYLAKAFVFANSLERTNPGTLCYIVVADIRRSEFDSFLQSLEQEHRHYSFLTIDDFDYPPIYQMALRYNAIEYCTAIKPTVFLHLKEKYPTSVISYFDPDIECFSRLVELEETLRNSSVTVMPHLLTPIEDYHHPSLNHIMSVGVYNFGYVGINAASEEVENLLLWWQFKLEKECFSVPEKEMFYDQVWGNIFPCFVNSVSVLRHPGYNIAYWNLHERIVKKVGSAFEVNGLPLRFFHFSGYDPKKPEILSKHQDRYFLPALQSVKELCDGYGKSLLKAHDQKYSQMPYGWNSFGKLNITPRVRQWFHSLGPDANRFGIEPLMDQRFVDLAMGKSTMTGSLIKRALRFAKNTFFVPLIRRMPAPIQQAVELEKRHLRAVLKALREFTECQVYIFKKTSEVILSQFKRVYR